MPTSKKFSNIKMGAGSVGNPGPQTYPAATVWQSACVPCRGARMVVFRAQSTDTNVPVSAAFVVSTSPNKGTAFEQAGPGGNGYNAVRNAANIAMNGPGGWITAISHADGRFPHDFVALTMSSHATNAHTGFFVDVEVWYDGDADDMRTSVGQYLLSPL